jgi:hypothetical protein
MIALRMPEVVNCKSRRINDSIARFSVRGLELVQLRLALAGELALRGLSVQLGSRTVIERRV